MKKFEPLAARMRPRTIDEFVGQEHILGPGRLLRRAIQLDQLTSLLFWGPPGTGKTTLARVIANTTKSRFTTLNAVLAGVKEVRETVAEAQEQRDYYDQRTILFVDEVHRWNKSQQDALLPWVENGTVVFIGATTENPFFKVNTALLSRSRVFQLSELSRDDLLAVANAALSDPERGYGKYAVRIDADALEHLVKIADGDARSMLNALELAVETTPDAFPPLPGEEIRISLAIAEESIQKKVVLYDREGDYHYDTISAFIKSLRGSDPDATFYWLARMVAAGEDPSFILRRMLIFASEDVGMADPDALPLVEAAAAAFERVGMPEGRYHLAHAALYLALAPKSNSCMGFFDALRAIEEESQQDVPGHLKDANRDKEGFGHGAGYLYPHAYQDHWVNQQYLPGQLRGRIFYRPSDTGREKELKSTIERRREAQLESLALVSHSEILTFTPADRKKEIWLLRAQGEQSAQAEDVRTRIFDPLSLGRHHNVLDLNAGKGLLVWEAARRVGEGCVVGLVREQKDLEIITHYTNELGEVERPLIVLSEAVSFSEAALPETVRGIRFEAVIGRNVWGNRTHHGPLAALLGTLLRTGGRCSFAERVPRQGTRLSELYLNEWPEGGRLLQKAEERLWANGENPLINWDENDFRNIFFENGMRVLTCDCVLYSDHRLVTAQEIKRWFRNEGVYDSYGKRLGELVSEKEKGALILEFEKRLSGQRVEWKTPVWFLAAERTE